MIKTITSNNGSYGSFGSLQIQPVANPSYQGLQGTNIVVHPSSPGTPPVQQVPLSVPTLFPTPSGIGVVQTPSVVDLVGAVGTNPFVIIPIPTGYNTTVQPGYQLGQDAGRIYDPRLTQGFVNTTTKFRPYEQLTGISQERPEVIMMTSFNPIFNKAVSHGSPHDNDSFEAAGIRQFMTPAGQYIDTQMHVRNLQSFNVQSHVNSLRTRFPVIDQTLSSRTADFSQALNALNDDTSFLLNLVRVIEAQKNQLDLRHDLYTVNPNEAALFIHSNFTQLTLGTNPSAASPLAAGYLPPKYDFVSTLQMLGFTESSVRSFSATKVWLQLLHELKNVIKFHSLAFLDIDPSYQRADTNPSTVLAPPVKYFGLAQTLPGLPPMDDLISLKTENAPQAIIALQVAFQNIYQNATFKNEESRIVALAHMLSQEYRYSYGLSRDQVVRAFQFYGYTVAPEGNSTMFDAVFGQTVNNITDIPAIQTPSLSSIAQQVIPNGPGVLTFETKYVEGDTGTLTPGGDYLFDTVLDTDGKKFNTSAIDLLTLQLDKQINQFGIMIDGLNLFSLPVVGPQGRLDVEASKLSNTADIITMLQRQLVSADTGDTLDVLLKDKLGSVYTQARTDNRIKTILFIYTLSRINRAYLPSVPGGIGIHITSVVDNTPLVDYLVDQLARALGLAVAPGVTTVQLVTSQGVNASSASSSLTEDSIKSSMRSGTPLSAIVEAFMIEVSSQFKINTSAIQNNFTRYSGFLDTVVMMVAFDYAISMIARYSNQSIVGTHSGLSQFSQGLQTYAVTPVSTNHFVSITELYQRARAENTVAQQLITTVIDSMRKLSGSLKGISNYLNSNVAKTKLATIAKTLNNDTNMIKMLFSEQQITLLASIVNSMLLAYVDISHSRGNYQDAGKLITDEITLLDDSNVSEPVRDALYGYLGTDEFSSVSSTNKRIMTVGIPLGFTQRLKQKVSITQQTDASFRAKRADIVNVTVYKVDVQNPDIVYKPQRFLFEMSRYPVRYSATQWLGMPLIPSLSDIIISIPTQNFTQSATSDTANSISSGVEYVSSVVAGEDGHRGVRIAFNDPAYSFLTAAQKAEILHNHVSSQLLETYVKLMTGIDVAEYHYDMIEVPPLVETTFIKTLTDHALKQISDVAVSRNTAGQVTNPKPAGGVLFSTTAGRKLSSVKGVGPRAMTQPILSNPAGVAGNVSSAAQFRAIPTANPPTKTFDQQKVTGPTYAGLTADDIPSVLTSLRSISSFANTLSSVSSPDALNVKVLSPKQFDRVFTIMIDPADFQVDVDKTVSTPFGKDALQLMISNGDIVAADENTRAAAFMLSYVDQPLQGVRDFPQNRASPNVNSFTYRDRDKNQGDLTLDKYFVTIETLGEDE